MNEQPIREAQTDGLPEDAVADYLLANPDFFERHGNLLARLKLPHHRDSAAISLHERQLHVLREKHAALEGKLRELIENARANQVVVDRVHRLTLRLLGNRDARGVLAAVDASLREDFGASNWVLLITDPSLQELAGTGFPRCAGAAGVRDLLRVGAAAQRAHPRKSARLPVRHRRRTGGLDGPAPGR
jgi:uncharacterized protein YigA (DUF484 family)